MDRRSQALHQWVSSFSDWQVDNFHMISGDASFRRYFRFFSQGQPFIAVDAPPETEKNTQFVGLSSALLQLGIRVPKVLSHDFKNGFLVLEDFGDALFANGISAPQAASGLYQKALTLLPQLQKLPQCDLAELAVELPQYDGQLLAIESDLFSHWLLEVHLGLVLSAGQRKLIERVQHYLTEVFFAQPQVGVHRDYHSRNLMLITDDTTTQPSIGVIDFQDAVLGPLTYDMVSLLRDCYVAWPEEFVEQQLRHLHGFAYQQYDWVTFKHWFDCTGMQRHLKAAGIFARLCHRDDKIHYLQDIPQALNYVVSVGKTLSRSSELTWLGEFVDFIEHIVLPELSLAKRKVTENKSAKD